MVAFKELNDSVTLADQLQSSDQGPVVLINVFTVDTKHEDALVTAWSRDADYLRTQPGYISTQLHKGIGGSGTFVNYAIWESVESFRNAFTSAEFQERIKDYPDSAIAAPHLFKKLAVPGFCVA